MINNQIVHTDEKGNRKKAAPTKSELNNAEQNQTIELQLASPQLSAAEAILGLQQTYGNRYAQRLVEGERGDRLNKDIVDRIEARRGSGKPLDAEVNSNMSELFHQDFSQVKVHNDFEADKLAKELGAKAFTTGNDIFFAQNAYQPDSETGVKTLRHELAHVVQQSTFPPTEPSVLTQTHDRVEVEARNAETAIGPASLNTLSPATIALQPKATPEAPTPTESDADVVRRNALMSMWMGMVVAPIGNALAILAGDVDQAQALEAANFLQNSLGAMDTVMPAYQDKPETFTAMARDKNILLGVRLALDAYAGLPMPKNTILQGVTLAYSRLQAMVAML